jgi:hypothetical protein
MNDLVEIVRAYACYGVLAFVVTVFATPLAAQMAKRLGMMDQPDQKLKAHARPIPYRSGSSPRRAVRARAERKRRSVPGPPA